MKKKKNKITLNDCEKSILLRTNLYLTIRDIFSFLRNYGFEGETLVRRNRTGNIGVVCEVKNSTQGSVLQDELTRYIAKTCLATRVPLLERPKSRGFQFLRHDDVGVPTMMPVWIGMKNIHLNMVEGSRSDKKLWVKEFTQGLLACGVGIKKLNKRTNLGARIMISEAPYAIEISTSMSPKNVLNLYFCESATGFVLPAYRFDNDWDITYETLVGKLWKFSGFNQCVGKCDSQSHRYQRWLDELQSVRMLYGKEKQAVDFYKTVVFDEGYIQTRDLELPDVLNRFGGWTDFEMGVLNNGFSNKEYHIVLGEYGPTLLRRIEWVEREFLSCLVSPNIDNLELFLVKLVSESVLLGSKFFGPEWDASVWDAPMALAWDQFMEHFRDSCPIDVRIAEDSIIVDGSNVTETFDCMSQLFTIALTCATVMAGGFDTVHQNRAWKVMVFVDDFIRQSVVGGYDRAMTSIHVRVHRTHRNPVFIRGEPYDWLAIRKKFGYARNTPNLCLDLREVADSILNRTDLSGEPLFMLRNSAYERDCSALRIVKFSAAKYRDLDDIKFACANALVILFCPDTEHLMNNDTIREQILPWYTFKGGHGNIILRSEPENGDSFLLVEGEQVFASIVPLTAIFSRLKVRNNKRTKLKKSTDESPEQGRKM
jgi:hypothetical protein